MGKRVVLVDKKRADNYNKKCAKRWLPNATTFSSIDYADSELSDSMKGWKSYGKRSSSFKKFH